MDTKYDAILYVEQPINEASYDKRVYNNGKNKYLSGPKGFNMYPDADDPMLYNAYSFGNAVRQNLQNIGNGVSCKVTDFKKWVVVEISHHDTITGKTSSKTFLIVFTKDKGSGIVLSTNNRFRTISGADQACSYIRSACSALQSDTSNRIG